MPALLNAALRPLCGGFFRAGPLQRGGNPPEADLRPRQSFNLSHKKYKEVSMEGKSFIIQGLPFITIFLALLFFVIVRVISRFKKQALGDTSSKNLLNFQFEVKTEKDQPERIQLKCPALIDKSKGVMKVGIKELTINGAFVTCPNPFPVGESFPIKILLSEHNSQKFNAEVVWNNQNVLEEEIVTRGMKVRFLQLSESDRKMISEIISLRLQPKALS
jgi:hypothetical protein